MRPVRLDLAGFAGYRDETTVDFTDADFFALVGPTGAGKSTILDAICFALYGTVPRWREARSVANALAPSATEARVRLVFEVANRRYIATRVVRRDGKGRVKTAAAGLQRMPDGFDARKLDTGLTPDDLGEALAGTPSELDIAVPELLGLPYDQFVTCVVLPQGDFAEFLHAKPAVRQQILVNLLGFSVYERVRELATERATRAEADLAATDRLLADLTGIDDAAIAEAEARVATVDSLLAFVEATVPRLAQARAGADRAAADLRTRDEQIRQLSAVRAPAGVAALATAAAEAREASEAADDAITAAEEREEKLRGELAAAGDATALRRLLDVHTERTRLATQRDQLTAAVTAALAEHAQATAALEAARAGARTATEALEAAREAYHKTQAATALRRHLIAGEPCPVCTQPVAAVPEPPAGSPLAEAERAGKQARAAADAAERLVAERDAVARELDRALAAARAQAEAITARIGELDERLAEAPPPETVRRELTSIAGLERRLAEATAAVRTAREAARRARTAAEAAGRRVTAGWREFDATRDALAGHRPPPADRTDLAAAWTALAGWARETADGLAAGRAGALAAVAAAEAEVRGVQGELSEAFQTAGVPGPGDDPVRAASIVAERARAELAARRSRREQAEALRQRRAGLERDAQVARALAQHLRANNFEAWLLAEALDRLVAGASAILRELTAGQYDLIHDAREFFVVDHHDAGLRRPVRTLSGGETFQASLALALALSEQLAGVSATGASLESIVLDEGFGTLDASTLDAVAATLESLAARGDRMVGVVTHVPTLAERVPVRYEVSKDTRSARVTRVGP